MCGIAREGVAWAGELKTGLRSEFDPVHRAAGPENQNWRYAASSHNTGQNHLNPLTQHQGGKFWTKPNSLEDKSDKVH